ncbi:MAG: CHASE3 domain-containing protein [Bacteroidetes bacterium]|nr:CHASE3 domain-containing protein [Bacteroidota bacterium]
MSNQALWMDHTNKVITNLEFLASEYKTVELNFRAYMSNRSPDLLVNLIISKKNTDSLLHLINDLTSQNEYHHNIQQLRLDTIRNAIETKFKNMQLLQDTTSPIPADITLKDFLQNMGGSTTSNTAAIIKRIKEMESYEGYILQQRADKLMGFNKSILTINVVSLIIAIILAIYSLYTYVKENTARQYANAQSEKYKGELENRVNELARANMEIKELRSSEKFASTGRIARTIAHEVRNPLTNINLATEQIRESNAENEENTMLLDIVKRNSLRINQLISDLLNATKFSELSFNKMPVNKLLDEALELAKDRISLEHSTFEKNYTDENCIVEVDEEKIKIAFLNIIVNGLEATEPGKGILKITTEKVGTKCKIKFEDNGKGMTEEEQMKLFEPFFTSKEKGNGLGLTNTQNIILNHKGKIEVESIKDKGSIFTITLNTVS